jgi:hypothetical protein
MPRNAAPDGEGALPTRQRQVLEAPLTGASITGAAETTGIDRTTIHRWLKEDLEFQAALNTARREMRRELDTGWPRGGLMRLRSRRKHRRRVPVAGLRESATRQFQQRPERSRGRRHRLTSELAPRGRCNEKLVLKPS